MNAAAQVLQAVDAVQECLRTMLDVIGDRAEIAEEALRLLATAPWSMIARPQEAETHGWLAQLQEALERIARDPEGDDVSRRVDEARWAADELERDVRRMLTAH